jgi:predicted HAD superfamily Cof-like phosphohydrolase
MDIQASVRAFHEATLIPIGSKPSPLAPDRLKLRLSLFDEFIELLEASGVPKAQCGWLKDVLNHSFIAKLDGTNQDVVEQADALGDIVVVAFGMAIEMGVDLNRVLAEIMRANMSKLDENGRPLINQCSRGDCEQPCMESTHWPKPDDPHGKVLKASGYRGPDIHHVLNTQEPL